MTRIAGSRPVAEVRQRGPQQPHRAPQRPVDGGLPGGLIEVVEPARWRAARVDDQQVQPAQRLDRSRDGIRRARRSRRSAGTATAPSRAAAASSFAPGRPISPSCAPSAPSAAAIAPPSPPLPPPTSARAPSSPRSMPLRPGSRRGLHGSSRPRRGRIGRAPARRRSRSDRLDGARLERDLEPVPPGRPVFDARAPCRRPSPMTVKWLGHCDGGLTDVERLLGPSAFIRTTDRGRPRTRAAC